MFGRSHSITKRRSNFLHYSGRDQFGSRKPLRLLLTFEESLNWLLYFHAVSEKMCILLETTRSSLLRLLMLFTFVISIAEHPAGADNGCRQIKRENRPAKADKSAESTLRAHRR